MGTLRLLLALAVVISHTKPVYGFVGIGGGPAVMAFFIISGFYMHLVLDTRYRESTLFFYANRALRLMPAYWFTLAMMCVLAASGSTWADNGFSRNAVERTATGSVLAWLALVPNIFIVGSAGLRQIGTDPQTGHLLLYTRGLVEDVNIVAAANFLFLPQIWSVANEIIFYGFAPLFVRLRHGFAALLIAAYGLYALAYANGLEWRHLLPNFNLIFFLFGMAAYRLYPAIRKLPKYGLVALTMLPFVYFAANGLITVRTSAVIWIPFAIGVPALFHVSKNFAADRFLGDLSYPIYLVHFMFAASNRGPLKVAIASILVATMMVLLIDRPIERLRHSPMAALAAWKRAKLAA